MTNYLGRKGWRVKFTEALDGGFDEALGYCGAGRTCALQNRLDNAVHATWALRLNALRLNAAVLDVSVYCSMQFVTEVVVMIFPFMAAASVKQGWAVIEGCIHALALSAVNPDERCDQAAASMIQLDPSTPTLCFVMLSFFPNGTLFVAGSGSKCTTGFYWAYLCCDEAINATCLWWHWRSIIAFKLCLAPHCINMPEVSVAALDSLDRLHHRECIHAYPSMHHALELMGSWRSHTAWH